MKQTSKQLILLIIIFLTACTSTQAPNEAVSPILVTVTPTETPVPTLVILPTPTIVLATPALALAPVNSGVRIECGVWTVTYESETVPMEGYSCEGDYAFIQNELGTFRIEFYPDGYIRDLRKDNDAFCVGFNDDVHCQLEGKKFSIYGKTVVPGETGLYPTQRIPDFTYPDLTGTPRSLGEFDGVKVLHFWGSWCQPCIKEMDTMKQISASRPDITFVWIAIDDTANAAREALPGDMPENNVFLLGDQYTARRFHVEFYPESIILDDDDIIVYGDVGRNDFQKYLPMP